MKKIFLFTLVIIAIPFLIICLTDDKKILNKIKYGSINTKSIRVKKLSSGEILNIPLEEYVTGVVAGEMPVSFNIEALKAQAVASRTYVLKREENNRSKDYDVDDSTNNQAYISYEDMKLKWLNNYDDNLKKLREAINQTKGEVVLYNNELIDALFFSTSNGYTENSADVFSSSKPYLVSVESKWDEEESPVFNTKSSVSKKEFLFNLGITDSSNIKITDITKTTTGRVKSIKVNGQIIKSDKIRKVFNLKSTSFQINLKNDMVEFITSGYGHGVGMSQYGANGMAKEGKTYQEILKYYYKNCDIKKIN